MDDDTPITEKIVRSDFVEKLRDVLRGVELTRAEADDLIALVNSRARA